MSRKKKRRNWIAGAVEHKGTETAQAEKVGESPMEFAEKHKDAPGITGKRSRLALTLRHLNKH